MSEQSGRAPYLTVDEVAELMRVSRMTVYRLLHSGELPGIRVGRSFRVPQEALSAFLRSSATVPQPEERREGRLSS